MKIKTKKTFFKEFMNVLNLLFYLYLKESEIKNSIFKNFIDFYSE